ncbi:transcription factor PCL1 [Nicotiana tabacum]|uniref:Transcription factor PCL1 n=2 Tax=Nicotiana TaxID=4085 RepID=A0A1S3YAF2_TOBAC|nr:PREDICTED: transcription factor PCL1-like [Nicotiana sylvestris]XP_009779626.1 PREDICTED: transcription factor PCL1-like [Nicotiana sylvestris]XP_009779627.1 PREDICTED: transcription factor PCL1-like [Nicotiana sylvestris]XP_016448992.1 PREDICTED: transcription factor PCL1-like [Nicotiana tabacum]XP_016448993.1 PREDICTED: transcription factor PCL1-like [Nicotiana tabacum]XP_016448994.1 PREDICTED: transcription factor PCL1-like [Nicotiana tabacum]
MGEKVKLSEYDSSGGNNDDRVLWEVGLPGADDLTPLTLQLIPAELASAFRISPESSKSMTDVNRASQNTFSSLQRWHSQDMSSMNNLNFKPFNEETTVTEKDETDLTREGSDPRKLRRVESGGTEEIDSALCNENCADDSSANKTLNKRARLVWTPQLHKRFIEVVAHLGIKNAVPKTIMQLMNVEGLTRENVASHLQKYRLYMKRQGNEGPSSSDHLVNSTPVKQSLRESGETGHHLRNTNGHVGMPTQMPYPPQMVQMPMIGMAKGGMPVGYGGGPSVGFHHQYSMMQQQREWSGNNFGYYHPVTSNDK